MTTPLLGRTDVIIAFVLYPDLVPNATFWAIVIMSAAIGVPLLVTGKRLARDPSRRVRELVGFPMLTLGVVVGGISAVMLLRLVFTWLYLLGMLWLAAHPIKG
jgi:hypothetical protein